MPCTPLAAPPLHLGRKPRVEAWGLKLRFQSCSWILVWSAAKETSINARLAEQDFPHPPIPRAFDVGKVKLAMPQHHDELAEWVLARQEHLAGPPNEAPRFLPPKQSVVVPGVACRSAVRVFVELVRTSTLALPALSI